MFTAWSQVNKIVQLKCWKKICYSAECLFFGGGDEKYDFFLQWASMTYIKKNYFKNGMYSFIKTLYHKYFKVYISS